MDAKKAMKFTAGVCAALGVVAIGAVVASGAAVKVVSDCLKTAKDTMQETMKELRPETGAATEPAPEPVQEIEEITPADIADPAVSVN